MYRVINKSLKKDTSIETIYIAYFRLLKKFRGKFSYQSGKRIIHYDPVISGIGWPIYFKGAFEKDELDVCTRFLTKKSIIFDIGANIGIHSLFYSEAASEGMVYAFEPAQNTYKSLLNNIKSVPNIIPLNVGLSKVSGILTFYECENDALSGLKNTLRSKVSQESRVVCFSGDELFRSLPLNRLDFIKIDVEGLEQDVFEGMKNIISSFMPVIFCEIYAGLNSNRNPVQTINYLADMGYSVYVLSNKKLLPYVNHNDREYNYFFIPKNKTAEFNLS
jgi:FkbM family methyltransferase